MKNTVIEFTEWNPDGTKINLEFTEDDNGLNIHRFHDFCKRFAYACGYMQENIEEVFRETNYDY